MSVETEFYGRSRFPRKDQDEAQPKIVLKVEVEEEKKEEKPKRNRWNSIFHALFPTLFAFAVYCHCASHWPGTPRLVRSFGAKTCLAGQF